MREVQLSKWSWRWYIATQRPDASWRLWVRIVMWAAVVVGLMLYARVVSAQQVPTQQAAPQTQVPVTIGGTVAVTVKHEAPPPQPTVAPTFPPITLADAAMPTRMLIDAAVECAALGDKDIRKFCLELVKEERRRGTKIAGSAAYSVRPVVVYGAYTGSWYGAGYYGSDYYSQQPYGNQRPPGSRDPRPRGYFPPGYVIPQCSPHCR